MSESSDINKGENKELSEIYKIFKEIYSKAPPILRDLSDDSIDIDYKEYVNYHIDFKKIDSKFQEEKYESITDAVKDIRHTFLNCYKFYGAKSDHTIQTLKLEKLLEQHFTDLDDNIKRLTDIQLTFNLLNVEQKPSYKFRYPKNCYDSIMLRCVAHFRPERLKNYHKILSCTLTTNEDDLQILEELISWENEIYFNDHYRYISSMWELPEIGNFVSILFKKFDIDIVNQGEIERMFLMPKESTAMSKIMTTLMMPIKKAKCISRVMPYKVWSEKLSKKVSEWYKVYHKQKRNKVMNLIGIHPDFWAVLGDKNPLIECDFCELSYLKKVWLIKGLCDHVTNKYKTVSDVITNCNEKQCTIWKNDTETEEYFFFKTMPDLRIYYYHIPYDEPSLEFLETEEIFEETYKGFRPKSRVSPNEKHFKLIADSVQGLRSFLDELDIEDTSAPDDLICALESFISEIESEECNLITLNNMSKIKLFKDWKSYSERCKTDEEDTLFWEEKETKPSVIEEVPLEKRKRKTIVLQDYEIDNKICDSDEYCSENDLESMCDYTDSEDEWGAINQPRKKQTNPRPSKLDELEKRLKKESQTPKKRVKNVSNIDVENNSSILDQCNDDIKKNALINEHVVPTGKKQNEETLKNLPKTISSNNESEKKLPCPKNTNNEQVKIEVSSDEDIISIDSEPEENEKPCKKQKYIIENNQCNNKDQPNAKKVKIDVLKNIETVALDDDDDDIMEDNQNTLGKDNSELIIANELLEKTRNTNEQNNRTKNQEAEPNVKINNEIISVQDDDDDDNEQIVISDDDDVEIVSVFQNASITPSKVNRYGSLNNNMNKSRNPISRSRPVVTNYRGKHQVKPNSIPKLSPNISIMPANVHVPKGIEVTVVKKPQATMPSHFNATKRSTIRSSGRLTNNPSEVNVKCKVISKPNWHGEAKFYVSLPNGKQHPVSDELMNQYLKEHNNRLPDYWIVPLPIEVARQYGFELQC